MELTEHERAIVDDATEQAFDRLMTELVEKIAVFIENWNGVPPSKYGRRAQLAADIRRAFKNKTLPESQTCPTQTDQKPKS